MLLLVYLEIEEGAEPPTKGSLDQDQQRSLSIDGLVEGIRREVPLRCPEDSRDTAEGRCAIFLEHFTDLLEIFLGL